MVYVNSQQPVQIKVFVTLMPGPGGCAYVTTEILPDCNARVCDYSR